VKIAEYNDMMAYLTRRQKFAFGGVSSNDTILPKPNPLSPQERNQKVFDNYVGRMKHYLTAAEMPEWFVKDLITKKAEELGIELKAEGGRINFKHGGTWADWKVNYEDQMSFEEYLQDDVIVKTIQAIDKKAEGGSIQPRRQYWAGAVGTAAPVLTYPVMLGIAETLGIATAGVGATALSSAVSDKIKENPEILNTPQAKAIMLSLGITPTNLFKKPEDDLTHKSVPVDVGGETYIGDTGQKEKERERIAAAEKKKYDDIKWGQREKINVPTSTGHPPLPPEKWEPPKTYPPKLADTQLPGFPIPEQKSWEEYVHYKKKADAIQPDTVEEITEIIDNYREGKTKKGSTQPIMKDYEKLDLINLVKDKFEALEGRVPSYTDLKTLLPQMGDMPTILKENKIELGKAKADYDRTDPAYIEVMETKAQKKAIDDNTLTYFAGKNFFPETITYNGETYDAEEFFMNNLIEKAKHGKWRKTGKTTLKNEELAKLYNTNERKIEEVIKNIRKSPEWNVKEPPSIPRSYHDTVSLDRIIKANKKLSPIEKKNVDIQDNWIWEANQDLGSRSLKSVKKNKPQLIKELQWKLRDGEIVQEPRSDEKLAEDLKKFFSVNHNVKRSTEQFNIQTLVNRGLTTTKINFLLNSIEAYIKKNPTHIRKIQSMDKFLRKRGLRIRIDGVSEELLDKLGKKNNFFGADPSPKGMFNSGTGQSVQWEKYLKFLDLALDGPEGVPLKKELSGVSKETIRKKYEGVVDERLLNNMLNDTDPGRLAEVMATIDEQLIMQGKGMGPDEIIEATKESWKRKKQARGGPIYGKYANQIKNIKV
jgi:hypothetical protein